MMLDLSSLPKNENGFRTTHTCELCGFEPKTKNKYREKQDHLVMKHFKERIDKIFPNCRPYSCPTGNCAFTGKDKQALLRHYTGKHGILERFLREALAEKGINYAPNENGKRRHSESNGKAGKNPRLSLSPPGLSQMTELNGDIDIKPVILASRPNTEELRKEVEAMMRSFQPVEQQPSVVVRSSSFDVSSAVNGSIISAPVSECAAVSVSSLPSIVLSAVASATAASAVAKSRAAINLPTQPVDVPTITVSNSSSSSQSTISVVVSRNPLGPSLSCLPLPIEVITNGDCDGSVRSSGSSSPVVENDDVMWGAAPHVGNGGRPSSSSQRTACLCPTSTAWRPSNSPRPPPSRA